MQTEAKRERFEVNGTQVLDEVKRLIHEGNVRRVIAAVYEDRNR